MPIAPYRLKAGDTEPLEGWITDRNGPVNLSGPGTIVTFAMRREGFPAVGGTAIILDNGTVAERGHFRYVWPAGQNATPGVYRSECRVTLSDGTQKTYPHTGWRDIIIEAQLT